MIEVKDVTFSYYDSSPIIQSFNFEAYPGEIIHIIGSSGCGKTTLLNLLCGVIPKNIKGNIAGNIIINNTNINELTLPQISPLVSLLMQDPEVQLFFPTVEQELAFGPENLKNEPDEIQIKITNALEMLKIEHLRNRETANLSFGEKKLVAFAALITLDPQIFLLDEPTAGISSHQIERIKEVLNILTEKRKIIFIAEHLEDMNDISHKTINLDGLSRK